MVSPASGSRPIDLTQADVDDLVRGTHEPIGRAPRTPSPEASEAAKDVDMSGGRSRPTALSPNDIDSINRTGRAPARITKRLAEAERVEPERAPRGRRKAAATGTTRAPSITPPDLA